jgi:hypothetical protein
MSSYYRNIQWPPQNNLRQTLLHCSIYNKIIFSNKLRSLLQRREIIKKTVVASVKTFGSNIWNHMRTNSGDYQRRRQRLPEAQLIKGSGTKLFHNTFSSLSVNWISNPTH